MSVQLFLVSDSLAAGVEGLNDDVANSLVFAHELRRKGHLILLENDLDNWSQNALPPLQICLHNRRRVNDQIVFPISDVVSGRSASTTNGRRKSGQKLRKAFRPRVLVQQRGGAKLLFALHEKPYVMYSVDRVLVIRQNAWPRVQANNLEK